MLKSKGILIPFKVLIEAIVLINLEKCGPVRKEKGKAGSWILTRNLEWSLRSLQR